MKPLRILLGNNSLSLLAGSETWTLTLAIQLRKMGHLVHCFSPQLGIISEALEKAGVRSFDRLQVDGVAPFSVVLEEEINHTYDVIIANHNHIVEHLRSMFPKTPIISTIHGIIHTAENDKGEVVIAPEHPALSAGVNQFVAVSEEVQEKLKTEYSVDSIIIRNFFDLSNSSSLKVSRSSTKGKPKQFLLNSNYTSKDEDQVAVIREAAKHYDAKVAAVGMNFAQSIDLNKVINDSDVVFGMGRSVLEGVAAGRLGIVHGRWGTGGPISQGTIEELRTFNFSGRNSGGKMATKSELIAMIDKFYTPTNLNWGKSYILGEHNVVLAASMYVKIARDLLGLDIVRPQAMKVYRKPIHESAAS